MKFRARLERHGKAATGIQVPPDVVAALGGDDAARSAFDAPSYSHQLRHVQAIESAKTEQTRQRRVEKALADLRQH